MGVGTAVKFSLSVVIELVDILGLVVFLVDEGISDVLRAIGCVLGVTVALTAVKFSKGGGLSVVIELVDILGLVVFLVDEGISDIL
jgi:hypothetical protein